MCGALTPLPGCRNVQLFQPWAYCDFSTSWADTKNWESKLTLENHENPDVQDGHQNKHTQISGRSKKRRHQGKPSILARKQGSIINVSQEMLAKISVCTREIKEYTCNPIGNRFINRWSLRPKKQRIDQAINNEEWGFWGAASWASCHSWIKSVVFPPHSIGQPPGLWWYWFGSPPFFQSVLLLIGATISRVSCWPFPVSYSYPKLISQTLILRWN